MTIAGDVLGAFPLFCEPLDCSVGPSSAGNFAPREGSPVLVQRCGRMGALDAGVCTTAIERVSWGAIKARYR